MSAGGNAAPPPSPFSPEGYAGQNIHGSNDDFVLNRFLKSLDAAAASDSSVASKPLGLALFGLGRMGSLHLGSILSNPAVNLRYVLEPDPARREACGRAWGLDDRGVVLLHPDEVDRAVADPAVDAVVVATPSDTHEAMSRAALAAGKHVFCEKPLAPTVDAVRDMYSAAGRADRVLFCAFNRRFDPTHQDIRARVRRGEVGRVQMIRAISKDSPTNPMEYLRTSGGIFVDSGCHDVDLVTHVIGELPHKVYAAGSRFHPEYADLRDFDLVNATLHFPSGALGCVEVARHSSFGHDQRLEVFGAEGMLQAANQTPLGSRLWNRSGVHAPRTHLSFFSRYWEAYKRELEHFVELVGTTASAEVEVADTVTDKMVLAVFKVCAACQRSAETGQPVELRWEPHEIPPQYRKQ